MKNINITTDSAFERKIESYPDFVKKQMQSLRALIIETAQGSPEVKKLEETLKWGEPSFVTKTGSTLRMDWKTKTPNQYQLYFKCTSKLVETFKIVFGNQFDYEKNRAIVFQLDQNIPTKQLKKCIQATLLYHKVKNDTHLGIVDD